MPTAQEKSDFSARLQFALRKSQTPVKGATDLARLFNLKHLGQSVSVQTAHKWLRGRAIPKADKIETLTQWLNVSAHWLRYGPPPVLSKDDDKLKQTAFPSTAETLVLAQQIEALSEHQRYLIGELVKQLSEKQETSDFMRYGYGKRPAISG